MKTLINITLNTNNQNINAYFYEQNFSDIINYEKELT